MALDNPALSRVPAFSKNPTAAANGQYSAEQLRAMYEQPSANAPAYGQQRPQTAPPTSTSQGGGYVPPFTASSTPMTYENTIRKVIGLFVVLLAGAAVSWFLIMQSGTTVPMWVGMIAALGLGIAAAFRREPSPTLYLLYAAAEGLAIGGISAVFDAMWNGIVFQAVLATLAVFTAVLLLFSSGKVRTSPKANKVFFVALVGYGLFSVVNVVLMVFGAVPGNSPFGIQSGWLGIAIGVLAVLLASYSLIQDFEFIQQGVRNKADKKYGWTGAFGLMVTLVWLYVEILRLLAISRS